MSVPSISAFYQLRSRYRGLAIRATETLRTHPDDAAACTQFNVNVGKLGYALVLKRYSPNVTDATEAQINAAAQDTILPVLLALGGFWSAHLDGDVVQSFPAWMPHPIRWTSMWCARRAR